MSEPENLLSEWSLLFMASLADAGVRDVVMSPGSRSTPLVAATLREPRLQLHSVIDERAASFFALGQARVTGRPSVLLCTSGSAGAHYFPAVIEANASGLPLIALTADRPTELMDCGAAQTIDQTKLFGDHVRRFIDLGAADASPLALRALRRMAAQAYAFSMHPLAGAVHVNARARKPLEPAGTATTGSALSLAKTVARIREMPIARVSQSGRAPSSEAIDEIAALCAKTARGILVCGPMSPASGAREAIFELARRTRYPILPELPSQMRLGGTSDGVVVCDGFDAFLRSPAFREAHAPELVIQIGSTPTSTGFEQYTYQHADVSRVVIAEGAWVDPASTSSHFVSGEIASVVAELASRVPQRADDTTWGQSFAQAAGAVRDVVESMLPASEGPLTEAACAQILIEELPQRSGLMLANSLPIRTADVFAARRDVHVSVFCQRGANGIDGLVAGSCGSAQAMKEPFTLYIGDVSLLHDLTSLALARPLDQPFVVVVVQNNGGRIFEQLPLGAGPTAADPPLAALFQRTLDGVCTPHAFEFSHAAAMFGLTYSRPKSKGELREALRRAYATRGPSLVEVVVPPHGAVEEYRRLWRDVGGRLSR